MRPAAAVDEYMHDPGERRLRNESYYFHFDGDDVVGHTRIGFQPYEERANVWFYVHDRERGRTYWHRDEELRAGDHHGLRTDGPLSVAYRIREPNVEWQLLADGTCRTSDTVRDIFASDGAAGAAEGVDRVPVSADLTFHEPVHDAYQEHRGYDAHSEDKEHYSQPGRVEGAVTVDGEAFTVDASGFRDHSWGGLRNWTPVAGGYYWFAVRTETGGSVKAAAGARPDGTTTDTIHGHVADPDGTVRPVEDVSVDYGDGLTPDERRHAWLDGDLPPKIAVDVTAEGGSTGRLALSPTWNTPLGYEDRNWAATELDTPWLIAVINRLPASATWKGVSGTGWYETMHPRVRVDLDD
jgi:hypothetical protein